MCTQKDQQGESKIVESVDLQSFNPLRLNSQVYLYHQQRYHSQFKTLINIWIVPPYNLVHYHLKKLISY